MTRCCRRYTTPDGVQHVNGSVANSNFRIVQERLQERIAQQRCALICRATSSGFSGASTLIFSRSRSCRADVLMLTTGRPVDRFNSLSVASRRWTMACCQ